MRVDTNDDRAKLAPARPLTRASRPDVGLGLDVREYCCISIPGRFSFARLRWRPQGLAAAVGGLEDPVPSGVSRR